MNNILFVDKYQPRYFNQFEINSEVINILETLIKMDNLNILTMISSVNFSSRL